MRPDIDGSDPNIIIINITGTPDDYEISDIEYLRNRNPDMPKDISITDEDLYEIVNKINSFNPSVIGIDIYKRDISRIQDK
jgi:CHASE2 domain-containing sensor protein